MVYQDEQDIYFHPILFISLVWYVIQMFLNCTIQSYPTHKHNLTNTMAPISQSYSNYHPPINACTFIFIIMLNCKNDPIFIMMYCMLKNNFPPGLRNIRLGGFRLWDIFIIGYIFLVFDLVYQTYKIYYTYVSILVFSLCLWYYHISTKMRTFSAVE